MTRAEQKLNPNIALAGLDALVGRSFVATSNNVAKIDKLGDGALSICWTNSATPADIAEFEEWMQSITGKLGITSHVAEDGDVAKAYRKWLDDQKV